VIDLACVIHVHSTFSDGTATVPEIVDAAAAAGADAVLLTDHDSLEAARQGLEGWHRDVLLLVGHEVTTERGHLLAFGLEREVEHHGRTESQICTEVNAGGGFGFAAHPFSRGGLIPSIIRPHPWRAIEQCESLGIELWSLVTDAAERWRSPVAALRFLRSPEDWLEGPPPEHLVRWDRLCAIRRVPAIGGLDAHQSGIRIRGKVLTPMHHERYFRLLRTHVLLEAQPAGELAADRDAIYSALRHGRCYLAVDAIAPAGGFEFSGYDARGRTIAMGAEVEALRCTLHATAPQPALLRLLRNGRLVAKVRADSLRHDVHEPGAYRAEAWVSEGGRERPWIISNPIYLR
jgi:hypothetical protein